MSEIKWKLGGSSGRMITTENSYIGDGFIADVDTKDNANHIVKCVNEHDELVKLSVTNIMLKVVPGDGTGEEIYAKSVKDVEDLLTEYSMAAEDAGQLRRGNEILTKANSLLEARSKDLESALTEAIVERDRLGHAVVGFVIAVDELLENYEECTMNDMLSGCAPLEFFTAIHDAGQDMIDPSTTPTTDEHLQKLFVEWLGEPVKYEIDIGSLINTKNPTVCWSQITKDAYNKNYAITHIYYGLNKRKLYAPKKVSE